MRLIDADKLYPDCLTKQGKLAISQSQIADTPTVEGEIEILTKEAYSDLCLRASRERPTGEWIEDSGNIACSHCHTIWLYRRTDFCPHCGADMRGGKE